VALYQAQNQIGKAIALLQQDLQKGPQSNNEVRSLLADVAERSGQYDLALAQYEQLARLQPDSAALALRLGLTYQKKHESAQAAAEFERASKLTPEDARAYGYLGQALDESGRKPEAIAADRRSLALDSHNPWVMNNLAYLMADTGGDLNEAAKLALEAVRLQPNEVSFSDTLGWVYLKKGDSSSALHVFESACQKNPGDVTFHIHLAMALLASGDRNKSRSELKAAGQLPASPQEKNSIARLLEKIGEKSQ
jgi:Flp pilus assembly protein TadD